MIGMFSPKVKAGDFCPPQFHQAIPIAATRFLRLNIVDNAPLTAVNLSFVIAINQLDCQWSNDLDPFWYTFFVYIR